MSYQAYIDNVQSKTGKTPADFAALAAEKELTAHGEIVAWLKKDFELGHGHATAVAGVLTKAGAPRASTDQKLDALFSGKKVKWRGPFEALCTTIAAFGPDVAIASGGTYVNLLRNGKKFGIVQPGSADRLDIGIKLKGREPSGRFEPAGAWNAMVTHRVRIGAPGEIDAELVSWLKAAHNSV